MSEPDIVDIARRAKSGEADAQYAFAADCARRGDMDTARLWLERAAAQDHADALFTLAGALLTASEGAIEKRAAAISGFRRAREKGSAAALRVLAALKASGIDPVGGWSEALAMMRKACEREDAVAKREIASILLGDAPDDADGSALLADASDKDPLAAALVQRRRVRGRAMNKGPASLDSVFERISGMTGRATGERREVSVRPRAASYRAAVGADLCDHVIGVTLPRLQRQTVADAHGRSLAHPHRTAWGAGIGFAFADLPSVFVGQRMAQMADVPYANGESLTVLRYRPGEQYRPHHDFLDPGDPDLVSRGQRVRTALLYLNDDYAGGETHFLSPGIKFAGKTGDILVFDNVDESGAPDISARHAGLPVERGEKWLATIWFRDQPFSG